MTDGTSSRRATRWPPVVRFPPNALLVRKNLFLHASLLEDTQPPNSAPKGPPEIGVTTTISPVILSRANKVPCEVYERLTRTSQSAGALAALPPREAALRPPGPSEAALYCGSCTVRLAVRSTPSHLHPEPEASTLLWQLAKPCRASSVPGRVPAWTVPV